MKKKRNRYGGIANLEEQAIRLFHLLQEDFPGISFEYKIYKPGECGEVCYPEKTTIDNRGKLRLDQNDGTPVPDDQYPNALLKDGSRFLQNDLPVEIGKKIDLVDISEVVDNIINEPRDKERNTSQVNYYELTRWRFRKGQHKTLYLAYEANDENNNGGVRITFTDGTNNVVHEQTGITSSWNEYTDSKNISTLSDGWCEIILEAKTGVGIGYIYHRRFTITIRRT